MEPSTKTISEYLNEKTKNQPLFRDDSGEPLTCGQAKAEVDALAAGLQDRGAWAEDVLVLRFPRTAPSPRRSRTPWPRQYSSPAPRARRKPWF